MTPTSRKPQKLLSLEAFATEQKAASYAENAEIARTNRALRSAVDDKEKELTRALKRLSLYEKLDMVPTVPPTWLTPTKPAKGYRAIPSLLLTDIHYDEVVHPREIGGVNAYNRKIADQRMERAFTGAIRMSRDFLSGVTYDGIHVFLGGDLLSGIIHEELRETNEGTVMDSIVSIVEPLEAGLKLLADHFGKVHVSAVVGNHGRNTRKPRAKHRATDSFDWLVTKIVERGLKADPRITFQISPSADCYVQLYQTRYCLTHGDQFSGGSGISGALAPLMLGVHRKRRRDAASGREWDILVMGHFHTSYFLKDLIVGGSLIGYNEYGFVNNLHPEPPQSAFWLTVPNRGISVSAPIFVQDKKAEGW